MPGCGSATISSSATVLIRSVWPGVHYKQTLQPAVGQPPQGEERMVFSAHIVASGVFSRSRSAPFRAPSAAGGPAALSRTTLRHRRLIPAAFFRRIRQREGRCRRFFYPIHIPHHIPDGDVSPPPACRRCRAISPDRLFRHAYPAPLHLSPPGLLRHAISPAAPFLPGCVPVVSGGQSA